METLKMYVSLMLLVLGVSGGDTAVVCSPHPSDVVFILDSSSSIWPKEFVRQLEFVENVTKTFDIGLRENQTRVGIITYSHKLQIALFLKDSRNKSDVISAIRGVPHLTGGTSTAKALWAVKSRMLLRENGGRDDVKKTVVVITDGMSHNSNATKMAAEGLKDLGVTIFAVGVGKDAQETELQNIASDPVEDHVFQVPCFQSLKTIQERLSIQACSDSLVPEESPQSDSNGVLDGCGGKPADVYFLLDSSSSIRQSDNIKQLEFVKDVVTMFDIGENKTRIGISTFSHKYHQEFNFQSYYNKDDLLRAIDKVSYLRGGTDTASALRHIRREVFTPNVSRGNVARILVVITDGYSRSPRSTAAEAALLHQMGVNVFAVGVTQDVDIKELEQIASQPMEDVQSFMFNVSNFDALKTIKNVLAIRTCHVVDFESACQKGDDTDVIFLLDVSSLGSTLSYSITDRINSAISNSRVKTEVHYGIMVSNCPDTEDKQLSSLETVTELAPRRSRFAGLVKKARLTGFSLQNGARPTARRVLFTFIDSELSPEAEIEIEMARDIGIDFIFAIVDDVIDTARVEPYVTGERQILKYDTRQSGKFEQVLGGMLCDGM
ncbi:cartilage matrix protein-like isoform X4 [Argopecten irradians]|uniref:cartilage matrix protein-like isoform X4 n=1 Tax=Argopecten irradians TaxID=31199 RepID=UPI00371F686B